MSLRAIRPPGNARRHRRSTELSVGLAATVLLATLLTPSSPAQAAVGGVPVDPANPNFGPNVKIFDPTSGDIAISTVFNQINNEAEFSTNRYAVLFKPGTYTVNQRVGYYNTVAGLGAGPTDVTINGAIASYDSPAGHALNNFWRGVENLTINPVGGKMNWAVSQASPMRRINMNGNIQLCGTACGYSSGGYLANSNVTGQVISGSQQQWFTRNSSVGSWQGGVWNMVFSGVNGAPSGALPNTVLDKTPISREKPYLFLQPQGGGVDHYAVYVPKAQTDSSSHQWSQDAAYGSTVPITNFYITTVDDTAATMNAALASGKNLLITPGVYHLTEPLKVNNPNQVIMGLGMATLVPDNGTAAIDVPNFAGVNISGLLIDAGAQESPTLVSVGTTTGAGSDAANPVWLNDVFFRIGGMALGKAATTLQVDADHVLLDNIWAWRADHGNGVGWTKNTAANGVIVNGNNVTALGLFTEHYQKNQVIWNGQDGTTIFYQSETPYDPPNQAAWKDGDRNGYASYFVSPTVTSHRAFGLGIYSYFNPATQDSGTTPPQLESAVQTPKNSNVTFHHLTTFNLDGNGGYAHVINDTGNAIASKGSIATVELYPGPDTTAPVPTCTVDDSAPLGKDGWYTGPVAVHPGATDDFVGALSVEADVDGAGYVAAVDPLTVSGDGTHTVTIKATDTAGNASTPMTLTLKIDGTAPVTTATATGRMLTLSSVDGGSGLAKVVYSVGDAVATAESTWMPYAGAVAVTNAATVVSFQATDAAGNVEKIGSYTFAAVGGGSADPASPGTGTATAGGTTAGQGGTGNTLAWTGVEIGMLIAAVVLLLGAGGVLLVVRRRRQAV